MTRINDKHKDRLFCYIFGREENKKWTLDLFNAMNDSSIENPDDIQIFTIDLNEGVQRKNIQDRMSVLKELHDKYVAIHDLEENIKDANDTINENTRQRKHLQESVMLLQKSVNQQKATMMTHFGAKSVESSQLISDLNTLQKENRSLRQRLELVHSDVEMLKSRLRAANREQQNKKARIAKSSIAGQRTGVMSDWIKSNQSSQGNNVVNVVDGRGKYLHSK